MNTTMVRQSGTTPISSVENGADAIMQLAVSPGSRAGAGSISTSMNEARANAASLRRRGARQLRALSLELTGLEAP